MPLIYALLYAMVLSGCVSPIALNRAVSAYDDAITSAASKQLLMNIARAHHHPFYRCLERRGDL
jgi:hypothetical protein